MAEKCNYLLAGAWFGRLFLEGHEIWKTTFGVGGDAVGILE